MPRTWLLIPAMLLAWSASVSAQLDEKQTCPMPVIAAALEKPLKLNAALQREGGDIIDAACKADPDHPSRMIAAIFYDSEKGPVDPYGVGHVDFAVALIDTKRSRVLALHHEVMESDAGTRYEPGSLWIDTGRYLLAPGVRAVGVRMNIWLAPSAPDGGADNLISLFVQRGSKLIPVLDGLAMSQWRFEYEERSWGRSGTRVDVSLQLSMANRSTQGFHDIEVHGIREISRFGEADEQPLGPKHRRRLTSLRYDGTHYESSVNSDVEAFMEEALVNVRELKK